MFFWPKSVENRAALRTACAALAAVLISFKFHLEKPFWSGMSVVIISSLYTGNIIDKAMLRIIGTIAGAFLGFFAAGLVANSFLLYILSCFLIISVGSYYYSFSVNGYAYLLGSLCAFIIISQIATDPQNAFFVAIWRPVEIGIGVLAAAVSAYFIFPNHLKDNIATQLDDLFNEFSAELKQLLDMLERQSDFDVLASTNLKIKKKIRKAVELIGAMNHELGVSKARTDEVRALLDIFYDLSRQLQYLIFISPQHSDLTAMQSISLTSMSNALQEDLTQFQNAFSNQLSTPLVLKTGAALAALEMQLQQKPQSDPATYSVPTPNIKSNFIYAFLHFLHQINRNFLLMNSLVTRVPVQMSATVQVIKTHERLRTDPDLIKRCIKAGLSATLAMGFWMVSNWPGGLNGIISSLVLSLRKNLFEMKNASIHRLLGCMLGGGIALFSLFALAMTLYDFILIFFFSVWGFTYFMLKSPKYSYIGLQANIALIISLAQEGGPPVYLGPPLQRLAGVVIGIVASFIVANLVWRSDVWTMLDRYLYKLYAYITQNLKQVILVSGNQKKLHDLANLFWTSRGLLESLADEHLPPKRQTQLNEQTLRFESLVMIQSTMSHILLAIDREKVTKTADTLGFNLSFLEQEVYSSFEQRDVATGLKLSHQIQEFLLKMNANEVFSHLSGEDMRGFLAYLNALNQLVLQIN
ncbi:MAG: FUSC family protein [Legionella sp.]